MNCYRNGGCGPHEMLSCSECPASKPSYGENILPPDYRPPIGEIGVLELTNWDLLRQLPAAGFSVAFWRILKQSQWYTDSRVWLREWLNAVPANGKLDLRPENVTTVEALNKWMKGEAGEWA